MYSFYFTLFDRFVSTWGWQVSRAIRLYMHVHVHVFIHVVHSNVMNITSMMTTPAIRRKRRTRCASLRQNPEVISVAEFNRAKGVIEARWGTIARKAQ